MSDEFDDPIKSLMQLLKQMQFMSVCGGCVFHGHDPQSEDCVCMNASDNIKGTLIPVSLDICPFRDGKEPVPQRDE